MRSTFVLASFIWEAKSVLEFEQGQGLTGKTSSENNLWSLKLTIIWSVWYAKQYQKVQIYAVIAWQSSSGCHQVVVVQPSPSGRRRRQAVVAKPSSVGRCHQDSKAVFRPSLSGLTCQWVPIAGFYVFNSKIVITIVLSMTSVSSESYYLTALIILPNKRCPKHTNEQRFKQRKSTLTQSYDVLSTYLDNT